MKDIRDYSFLDQLCMDMDKVLRTLFGKPQTTSRENPSTGETEPLLTQEQRQHSAGLMRVNHTGEVCAQALYHAQGLSSLRPEIKVQMQQAAIEEGDHLAWCDKRLKELGSHTSYLNPFWYAGSFALGLTAGLIGDKWNLGFLAETEQQVVQHLETHLQLLPEQDSKSYKILKQMHLDEASHRDEAIAAGGASLPSFVKILMRCMSRLMVKAAYRI